MDAESAEALLDLAKSLSEARTGGDTKDSREALETRTDELTVAIAWFIDYGRRNEALRLTDALYRFWIRSRRFRGGNSLVRAVRRAELGTC